MTVKLFHPDELGREFVNFNSTEDNANEHLKASIENSILYSWDLLSLIGKAAEVNLTDRRFCKILTDLLINHCSEDDLKYILSKTRVSFPIEDNGYCASDVIEQCGLYWRELVPYERYKYDGRYILNGYFDYENENTDSERHD